MRYFTVDEFDSPDLPGSGEFMSQDFLDLLEKARERAGIPFVITSGYRTREHSEYLKSQGYKVSKDSAHRLGLAADIKCITSAHRYKIIEALFYVGINRVGVGRSFIHADLDNRKHKPIEVIWNY